MEQKVLTCALAERDSRLQETTAAQNPTSNSQAAHRIAISPELYWGGVMTMTIAYPSILGESQNENRAEPVEIWKARKLIAEFSDEELSLTKIASQVKISGNYLSEKFKRVTGENFVRYVARVRIRKACDLLANSEKRVSEIAFAVGFQSLSQFNRVFRKLTRQSPTHFRAAYRKSLREKAATRETARDIIRKNA